MESPWLTFSGTSQWMIKLLHPAAEGRPVQSSAVSHTHSVSLQGRNGDSAKLGIFLAKLGEEGAFL